MADAHTHAYANLSDSLYPTIDRQSFSTPFRLTSITNYQILASSLGLQMLVDTRGTCVFTPDCDVGRFH
jgi:hypothetical protein